MVTPSVRLVTAVNDTSTQVLRVLASAGGDCGDSPGDEVLDTVGSAIGTPDSDPPRGRGTQHDVR
ncbi:hypothetical protein GCM10009548_71520 [Streptomyces malaysiensis subsp. malaysiensis]